MAEASDRATRFARWPRSLIAFAALFMLLPAVAIAGGQALPMLQGLAGVAGAPWREAPRWRLPKALWSAAAFFAWACVSALWCAAPTTQWARLLLVLSLGLVCVLTARALPDARRGAGLWFAAASCAALAALAAFEAISHAGLNRLAQPSALEWELYKNDSKGVTVLLCMLGPVAAWLLTRSRWPRVFAAALALAAAWLATRFDNAANTVAFATGGLLFIAGFIAPRLALRAFGLLAAAWALAAPWAMRFLPIDDALPFSWAARTHIWRFAAARVAEKPLFGWGLDAARSFKQLLPVQNTVTQAIPLHPHNVFLHVWLETGAVGAVLLAATLISVTWRAPAWPRPLIAGALGAGGVIFAIDNLSFGAWQEWWIAGCWLPIILLAAWAPRNPVPPAQ